MPGLRGAVVAECDLAGADVGRLVGLGVDEAALGLPEGHRLAHAETCPRNAAALLDISTNRMKRQVLLQGVPSHLRPGLV